MGKVAYLEVKRKERLEQQEKEDTERNNLINRAIETILSLRDDKRISRRDRTLFILEIAQILKRNRGICMPIEGEESIQRYRKLIEFGYIEPFEPFEWIVDEAFLGFEVGDSLGMVQTIRLNSRSGIK